MDDGLLMESRKAKQLSEENLTLETLGSVTPYKQIDIAPGAYFLKKTVLTPVVQLLSLSSPLKETLAS